MASAADIGAVPRGRAGAGTLHAAGPSIVDEDVVRTVSPGTRFGAPEKATTRPLAEIDGNSLPRSA